ncbi:amino acid adenylation domain-containing protein [Streptomyces aidingensis]|uniref:Amino acid adenylation domain-containing protein n=1 Tax=Streptomyces aidingensis TaxID=910347 RepID=A0A1I1T5L0_9ACTN|nr:amino acid adenylation domain-containing protein [Streptomyces aidingensis]SFD53872.1 amino acid adenylation domain-containing protein [Streptomyces aidingensis]
MPLVPQDTAGRAGALRDAAAGTAWRSPLLDRLGSHDRHLFQTFGSGPRRAVPHTRVHHAIERHAAARPRAVAAEHLGETITYGELDRRAGHLAARLARLGVRPGDRVALFTRRSIPMLVGLLAILKAGAAYVPQDTGIAPAAQLRHILRVTRARVVLTHSAHAHRVPAADGVTVLAVDELPPGSGGGTPGRPRGTGPAEPAPEDGCYVLFTSGTTGTPNGVTVTHANVCNLLLTRPGSLGIRPGDRVAQILSIAFDMASWEILGALCHGATLVVRGRDIAAAVRGADIVIATPTVLSTIDPDTCDRVRTVAVAGEPCPRALADRWARRAVFHNGCGPTETTIVNTMQLHTPAAARLTIGRPTPNNTVYVLDEHRRPLPIGETGEMWAGGAGVSAGYLGNPELTAERYAPDPFLGPGHTMFRTRDLGRWTPDGELEHLGRTDDQVKIRGFRVELDSVSAVLESLDGCVRAATVKLDDRHLVSFVTPATLSGEAARAAVAAALPYYCVPAAVHALEALPQTSRGKIDKAALRALAMARAGGAP